LNDRQCSLVNFIKNRSTSPIDTHTAMSQISFENHMPSVSDRFISALDNALKTLSGSLHANAPSPLTSNEAPALSTREKKLAGALMRVNHAGEICAQALYSGQASATSDRHLQTQFTHAMREEMAHLAWTQERLKSLQTHPSWFNPLWYVGSFGLGFVAGKTTRAFSLGFVVETERQVEQHLQSHLERLPANDHLSRSIVERMQADEKRHADEAQAAGAAKLPLTIRWLMRAASKIMTSTAYYF
jgi:3-demethoxyubiquinol 3-hydroxylase